MNWDALGSIAELVGAVAVLATLFFIARQMYETKTALQAQAVYEINFAFNQIHIAVASSPELSAAMAKAEEKLPLTSEERVRVRAYAIAQFNAFETTWTHLLLAKHPTDEMGEMIHWFLQSPGIDDLWQDFKGATSVEFQNFVDSVKTS